MPISQKKIDDEKKHVIEQSLWNKRYVLVVDKELCKGCDVCELICHTEAIELIPQLKDGEKARPHRIDINPEKCDYCGMCVVVCPFGAIDVTLNDEKFIPVVEKGSFPELIREINVDAEKCGQDCKVHEDECPLKIIDVSFEKVKRGDEAREGKKTIITIEKELCPCCKRCEIAFPPSVIKVRKFFNGTININRDKCPEKCQDCVDVCPVEALYLREDEKVYAKELFCMYCRACVKVCPVDDALEVNRTSIRHTPIQSGAWNKALEKLTSSSGVDRELTSKRLAKVLEIVKNRRL